jgi:hypothetical protein
MNFDQPFPEGISPLPYQISLDAEEFFQQMGDYYEHYAQAERADAPNREAGEFLTLDRWQELGYPPLKDLLVREPALLESLLKDWFGPEALDQILPGPEVGVPNFLINSIDRVAVGNGLVRIEGKAYPHPAAQENKPLDERLSGRRPS